MIDSWLILLLIIESFLFSFGSHTFLIPNKKIGFTFANSFIILFINRTVLRIHLVFSFKTLRNHFFPFSKYLSIIGMGHNYDGEPTWPNDVLYISPVIILGTIACNVGLAVLEPLMIGELADPFTTP